MNKSIVDKDREPVQPIQLIDCGRASEATRGLPHMLLFELGWPPNNRIFLI